MYPKGFRCTHAQIAPRHPLRGSGVGTCREINPKAGADARSDLVGRRKVMLSAAASEPSNCASCRRRQPMVPRQPFHAVPTRRPNASAARFGARRWSELAACETVWKWRHQTVNGPRTCSASSRTRACGFGLTGATRPTRPAPARAPTPDALPPACPLPALLRREMLHAGRQQRSAAAVRTASDALPSMLIECATWRIRAVLGGWRLEFGAPLGYWRSGSGLRAAASGLRIARRTAQTVPSATPVACAIGGGRRAARGGIGVA